jgi:membrane-associated phospholipid phosphatase
MLAVPASAQVTMRTTERELREMVSDVGHLLRSPVRADGNDWFGAALTGAGFAALLSIDKPVDTWVVRHADDRALRVLAPFREADGALDRLVTAKQLVPLSAALVVAGAIAGKRGLREAGYGCIAGWGMSNIVRYATYAVVARDRPSAGPNGPLAFGFPGGSWDQHSFFAGHATNAFACASFWTARFDLSVGEPVLYTGATLAALARIADRRHWTSDTFVGIITGIAIGHTVARRYERRDERRAERELVAETAAGASSNPADRAARHTRLVGRAPVVVLWRARF